MREDHNLQAAVQARLDLDPAINSSHIGVSASGGIVTISGHVPSLNEWSAAERTAGQVKGVKAVVNAMLVELGGEGRTSDEQIAARAYSRLASNTLVPRDRLHIAVQDGVVTLHGDVDWHFQLRAAINDLELLKGVRQIRTDAQIRPPVAGDRGARKGQGSAGADRAARCRAHRRPLRWQRHHADRRGDVLARKEPCRKCRMVRPGRGPGHQQDHGPLAVVDERPG